MAVHLITLEDLKGRVDDKDLQIINIVEQHYSDPRFITGSILIPLSELGKRTDELNEFMDVVVYSSAKDTLACQKAAEILQSKGFNVFMYEGSIEELKLAS